MGKGKVDLDDIKRLKKELFWVPGKCAYCNGIGKVPPDRIDKVGVDYEYLTTDLPSLERYRLISGNSDALKRGKEFKELIQNFVEEIENLYYIKNMEPREIVDHLFHKHDRSVYSKFEKQELVDYVEKVIKIKLKD